MALQVRALAGELGVPVGVVLEGGYDLDALAESVAATLEALAEGGEAEPVGPDAAERSGRGPGRPLLEARGLESPRAAQPDRALGTPGLADRR